MGNWGRRFRGKRQCLIGLFHTGEEAEYCQLMPNVVSVRAKSFRELAPLLYWWMNVFQRLPPFTAVCLWFSAGQVWAEWLGMEWARKAWGADRQQSLVPAGPNSRGKASGLQPLPLRYRGGRRGLVLVSMNLLSNVQLFLNDSNTIVKTCWVDIQV